MTNKELIKMKVPLPLALLIITALAVFAESVFFEGMWTNERAANLITNSIVNFKAPQQQTLDQSQNYFEDVVALRKVNIPLIPGAKRITFNNNTTVRYRIDAPADVVVYYYGQILENLGWLPVAADEANNNSNLEKISIIYVENPLSNKTDIVYSYGPVEKVTVLGIQYAQAQTNEPAPIQEPMQPQQPQPPMPPANNYPNQILPGDSTSGGQAMPAPSCRVNGVDMPGPCPANNGQQTPNMGEMQFVNPIMPNNSGDQQNQTCRVNGVDMPGSCQNYNNQGQNGQMGPMGQNGQMGQQGPSEEEMKKMDERRFNDMKKGLSQFSKGAKMMKKNLARVKTAVNKCGVGIPEELSNALNNADGVIKKIDAAQNADELDEIIGDIEDISFVMQDWGPRMGDLSRLCQTIKQADRDMKQIERSLKRVESRVKANKKIDLTEIIDEYKTNVATLREALAQAKELAKTDAEAALEKINDDFYSNMDDFRNAEMEIETALNISKGISDATREIKTITSQIKALQRKKIDIADVQLLLNDFKAQLDEVKQLIKTKFDADELMEKIEIMFDTRQELQNILQELGAVQMMPQIKSQSTYNVNVNLPDAFKKTENNIDEENNQNEPTPNIPVKTTPVEPKL